MYSATENRGSSACARTRMHTAPCESSSPIWLPFAKQCQLSTERESTWCMKAIRQRSTRQMLRTHARAHARAHIRTHTHARTHSHTRIHIHTHAHAHATRETCLRREPLDVEMAADPNIDSRRRRNEELRLQIDGFVSAGGLFDAKRVRLELSDGRYSSFKFLGNNGTTTHRTSSCARTHVSLPRTHTRTLTLKRAHTSSISECLRGVCNARTHCRPQLYTSNASRKAATNAVLVGT